MKHKERPIILPRNYIVLWFMIWLIAKTYKSPEPEYIAVIYFVCISVVLCQIYIAYMKNRLVIDVSKMPEYLNKEEKTTLKVTVYNPSFLPAPYIYIFLKDTYHIAPEEIKCLCVTLPPHSSKEYNFQLKACYSGKETIGIDKVVLNDFFEVARRQLKFKWEQEVVVLPQPKVFKGAAYLLNYSYNKDNDEEEINRTLFTEDGEISYELKPYIEGQSQRLMHWKLVAQRDIYMVREREKILKNKKERVVIMDPVITPSQEKPNFIEKHIRGPRLRWIWQQGQNGAKLRDKLVNTTTSYLMEVLKLEEKILFFYYENESWKSLSLSTLSDLEKISDKISSSILINLEKPVKRWPDIPEARYFQQILISASVDQELSEILMEKPQVKVLELQKQRIQSERNDNQYWYVTDDYKIVRNG